MITKSLYSLRNMDSTKVWILVSFLYVLFKCVTSLPLESEVDQNMEFHNDNETIGMEGKIVGGSFGKIEDFPHALFLYAECANSLWTCGSSVLTQQVVLTAAHCVFNCKEHFRIHIYAGSANYVKAQVQRQVTRYVVHGDYKAELVKYDIAIMMLNKRLPYSKNIKRIIIRPNKPKPHSRTFIAGWGSISEAQDISTSIKYVEQSLWSHKECADWLQMYEGTICAAQGQGSYPYTGDSGSGLITKDFQAVGVVSYRMGSIKKDLVVYTDVSHYYMWIREKVYSLYCYKKLG